MSRLKNTLNACFLTAFGFGVGVFTTYADQLVYFQKGFAEGRQSVLRSTVIVGDETSKCSVEIRLSVLADMVDVGVMDWHKLCTEDQPNDQ